MQTIKLTDQLGFDIDAVPGPTSALVKYFQPLTELRLNSLDLAKLGGLTLDQPAIQSLTTGVSFANPIDVGAGAPALSVSAGTHAWFKIIGDAGNLPGQHPGVAVQPDECWCAFGIEATVSANISVNSGTLTFGAAPSTTLEAVSYSRFLAKTGVTLLDALKQTVAAFSISARSSDLADMPAGHLTRVAVIGKLALSGSADLLATTNPLASASLPAPFPAVSVSAGGSATVGVSLEIESAYEVLARKLDSGVVRLGWHHKHGTEVAVHTKVSEGISAGFGATDLFSKVIGVISADARADLEELTNAGVPAAQAADIQDAVKAAVSRKLEIAVGGEISAGGSQGAAFLYEIVPSALTDDSRAAVDQALRGDLSALHAATLPGVSCLQSIWDNVRKSGVELNVNLLGILNYRSIARLALDGSVLYEPATGSLVISDQATAERIRSTQVNFGADTDKLRHVLAESFLITAAYHGSKQRAGAALLSCSHSFFELRRITSRSQMTRDLQIGLALDLLGREEAKLPDGMADFGRTLFEVSTDYDSDLLGAMFLGPDDGPLARDSYEAVGRNAIQFLVQETDDDAVRRRPAIEDDLWHRMKDVGQPGFGRLFPGLSAPLLGAVTADYSTIQWWADAMFATARQLAEIRGWLDRNSTATFDDPEFERRRQKLAKYLSQVAATTREEFGQPWGLIAMNQLVGRRSGAKILITGAALVRNKHRDLSAVTRS